MRVDRSVAAAREVLADPSGAHWPLAQLVTFAAEGVRELAAVLPHEFAEAVTVTLAPGPLQTPPPGYTDVVDLLGAVDPASGDVVRYGVEREISDAARRLRGRFECRGTGTISPLRRFKIVEKARRMFMVTPDAAGGEQVVALAVAEPPNITMSNYTTPIPALSDGLEPVLTHWIVARAYEVDAESDVANDRAAYFRNRFYSEVNAAYAAASRERSGYVLGEIGEPDGHPSPARFNERKVF